MSASKSDLYTGVCVFCEVYILTSCLSQKPLLSGCVLCEVCTLGVETAFIIKTTVFYNCEIGYCVHCDAWEEAEETVQYKAYNTK
jgi:hypothetical protein